MAERVGFPKVRGGVGSFGSVRPSLKNLAGIKKVAVNLLRDHNIRLTFRGVELCADKNLADFQASFGDGNHQAEQLPVLRKAFANIEESLVRGISGVGDFGGWAVDIEVLDGFHSPAKGIDLSCEQDIRDIRSTLDIIAAANEVGAAGATFNVLGEDIQRYNTIIEPNSRSKLLLTFRRMCPEGCALADLPFGIANWPATRRQVDISAPFFKFSKNMRLTQAVIDALQERAGTGFVLATDHGDGWQNIGKAKPSGLLFVALEAEGRTVSPAVAVEDLPGVIRTTALKTQGGISVKSLVDSYRRKNPA